MYGQFFNIDESAFSIAPNPKYLYLSKQHEEALAHLIYGVTRKGGFVCLTGDIGTGKTTICRCMFEQLPENTDIAFVINPKFSPMELLASICDELHLSYSTFHPNIKEYVKKLYTYLIEAHARGRSTVLVVDEAQNLSIEALEHIRALTNLETNEQKLLQIILIGQPELKTLLARPELEQVNQRITARFHIGPLSLNETNRYIHHRLLVAGAKQKIFSAANIKQIYKLAKGVPRRINILCDRVLLGAFTLGKNKISSQIIKQSAEEVFDNAPAYAGMLPKALAASVLTLLISGVSVFAYQHKLHDPRVLLSLVSKQAKNDVVQELTSAKSEDLNESVSEQTHDDAGKNIKNIELEAASSYGNAEKKLKEEKANYVALSESVNVESVKAETIMLEPEKFVPIKTVIQKTPIIEAKIAEETIDANNDSSAATFDKPQLRFSSYGKAYQQLFRVWGIDYSSTAISPCEFAAENKLQCYQGRGSIKKIIKLNRPVLLKSKSQQFGPSYIVIVSIEDQHAIVSEKGDYQLVSLADISENMSGEFELLWRPMQAGVAYIRPGQKGKAVALLDQMLAKAQGREPSTSHPFVYTEDLVNQVKAFQIANKLPADGVVGPITQMYFNNSETMDTPYLIK
jgi:general secretion pathway protein A